MKPNKVAIIGNLATHVAILAAQVNIEIVEPSEVFKPEPYKFTNSYKDLDTLYHPSENIFSKKERKCNNSKRPKPRKKKR